MAERIRVEVAVALPESQELIDLELPSGATIADAIEAADVARRFPQLEIHHRRLGVFGRPRPPDHVLADGDRVEIYRTLTVDPKEVRRQLARLKRGEGRD